MLDVHSNRHGSKVDTAILFSPTDCVHGEMERTWIDILVQIVQSLWIRVLYCFFCIYHYFQFELTCLFTSRVSPHGAKCIRLSCLIGSFVMDGRELSPTPNNFKENELIFMSILSGGWVAFCLSKQSLGSTMLLAWHCCGGEWFAPFAAIFNAIWLWFHFIERHFLG